MVFLADRRTDCLRSKMVEVLRRQAGQNREQVVLLRQARRLLPFRGSRQRIHRLDRLEFLLGDNGEEVAVPDHFHDAWQLLNRGSDRSPSIARHSSAAGTMRACTMPGSRMSWT